MPLSYAAIKAAEDAVWNYFEQNLRYAYFSFRDEINGAVIRTTKPQECKPGELLEIDTPKSTPVTIDSVWVVYTDAAGDEIMSGCLGQGRLNGWHAVTQVPTRKHIRLYE